LEETLITRDFSASLALGAAAPDFTLPSATGGQLQLSALVGPVVVFFTCNHCPYVVGWEGRLHDLAHRFAGRVQFVGINANDSVRYPTDDFAHMQQRASTGLPYAYVHDAEQTVARAWGAQVTPEFFLLDAEHRLAYHGRLDAKHDDPTAGGPVLLHAIEALLAGRPVPEAETEVQGCSVKWR
jgi:peroxiredoxin